MKIEIVDYFTDSLDVLVKTARFTEKVSDTIDPCLKITKMSLEILFFAGVQVFAQKKLLGNVKPFANFLKGAKSVQWLATGCKGSKKVTLLNISGIALSGFASLDIIKTLGIAKLKQVDLFFSKTPLTGRLSYGGVTSALTIVLLVSSILIKMDDNEKKRAEMVSTLEERKTLLDIHNSKKTGQTPRLTEIQRLNRKVKTLEKQIHLNYRTMAQKAIGIAAIVFTTAAVLSGAGGVVIASASIAFGAIDLGMSYTNYRYKRSIKTVSS